MRQIIDSDIRQQRLYNQHISRPTFEQPAEVVSWLGAVQAQDYGGAKWGVGLRLANGREAEIEQAFADGLILRTHIMRPTWHFVTPADIRWLQRLTAARVQALSASYYRQLELDAATFARSNDALAKALKGGKHLTRPELAAVLEQAGIQAGQRLGYLLFQAELDMVVCSGGRQGKQFTYALFDERVPSGKELEREEAIAELTRRYFVSHGPATIQDFVWWSGLTTADVRMGLEMAKAHLVEEVIEGENYWRPAAAPILNETTPAVYLLPAYDEYTVAYSDRRAILDAADMERARNGIFSPVMVSGGKIVGLWERTIKKRGVEIHFNPLHSLTAEEEQAFRVTAEGYGRFLNLPVM